MGLDQLEQAVSRRRNADQSRLPPPTHNHSGYELHRQQLRFSILPSNFSVLPII
ncbi:uncharacterized protein G2W53_007093 [Senna tora]|uniref:Uncharacterized protein n=1 Tax=Senna tora TaxID=362788 RepID=A0A834X5I1_9FABA|nr:uncharacterized protein G2W53_007093 [Senna tora]